MSSSQLDNTSNSAELRSQAKVRKVRAGVKISDELGADIDGK